MTVLTLIGCGKMGGAMLRGWIAAGVADTIHVVEPSGLPVEFKNHPVVVQSATVPASDVIVLAVKPQVMDDACAGLDPRGALVLSIAAGRTIAGFERHFGAGQPVIRAMPNTPAAIAKGITVAVKNAAVTPAQRDLAGRLLQSIGRVEWLDDENLMDAVTALSGSGPAYVFYLIEAMSEAGTKAGLPAALAQSLARQTVIGSAALADADPANAATLRQNVTSPGGTTEAALKILMDGRWQEIMDAAIAAATARSRDLSG